MKQLVEDRIVNKRVQRVDDLRERLKDALDYHLEMLENETELSPKDRIELIGRLLPFVVNKLAADKEQAKPGSQGDPIAAFMRN